MKKISTLSIVTFILLTAFHFSVNAQAYRKGSLSISISEGHTLANYRTNDISSGKEVLVNEDVIIGIRDPLVIEYGISNRWSVAVSSGNDIFTVNPSKFYGFYGDVSKKRRKLDKRTFKQY